MNRVKLVSVLATLFLICAGSSLARGEDNPTTSTSSSVTAEHATHDASVNEPTSLEHAQHAAAGSQADDAKSPSHSGHDMGEMGGRGDMSGQHEMMLGKMKDMRAQMDKIKATSDLVEKKQLMQEHMSAMANTVKMMRQMDGNMAEMMGAEKCPMMEMMSSQGQAGMKEKMGEMSMCQQMMRKKTEMNQGMMEQLIESQAQLLQLSK